MTPCPTFCEQLKTIELKDGILPTHNELINQLHFTDDDREEGCYLGTWHDIQQRTECGFCQLVRIAVLDTVDSNKKGATSSDQPIRILIFPGEQSFRLSYPTQLGLQLAFVTEDILSVSGPDIARVVSGPQIKINQIHTWLQICENKHDTCSMDGTNLDLAQTQLPKTPGEMVHESVASNFRLLDLELDCVSPAALDCKYVALSYVWGNLPMFRLMLDNFEQLSQAGGLETIRTELPKTINDAINLVKATDHRFLWIDALCLVQDDEDDVALGVKMMNSIYQGSHFTIVAGSGYDASAGLPGVCQNARGQDPIQVVKKIRTGVRMTFLHSIDWHLNRSVYNTRGWTLQELVLPRRTIVFVNGKIHFRCQEANWNEESWSDKWTHWQDPDDSNISRIPDFQDGFLQSFWAYQKLCEGNSRRRLRDDGDALRAFSGISRPLSAGMGTKMVEGLPGNYLHHFLLFISTHGNLRRRSAFASFSWAGWKGDIIWPRENFIWYDYDKKPIWKTSNIFKYFKQNEIVSFHALDVSAYLESLSISSWHKPSPLLEIMREHPKIFNQNENPQERSALRNPQWNSSSGMHMYLPSWLDALVDEDDEKLDRRMQQRGTDFYIEVSDFVNKQEELDRLIRHVNRGADRKGISNFVAGARLRLDRVLQCSSTPGRRRQSYNNIDKGQYSFRPPRGKDVRTSEDESLPEDRRTQCGRRWLTRHSATWDEAQKSAFKIPNFPPYTVLQFMTISLTLTMGTPIKQDQQKLSAFDHTLGIPLFSTRNQLFGSFHPDNYSLLPDAGSSVECLLIARCNTPIPSSALLTQDQNNNEEPWRLFWVLHVVWKDGIAERRGVGQVLCSVLEADLMSKPEARSVLLG